MAFSNDGMRVIQLFSLLKYILLDFYNTLRLLLKTKPKVVFFRGASRNLAFVVLVSKLMEN